MGFAQEVCIITNTRFVCALTAAYNAGTSNHLSRSNLSQYNHPSQQRALRSAYHSSRNPHILPEYPLIPSLTHSQPLRTNHPLHQLTTTQPTTGHNGPILPPTTLRPPLRAKPAILPLAVPPATARIRPHDARASAIRRLRRAPEPSIHLARLRHRIILGLHLGRPVEFRRRGLRPAGRGRQRAHGRAGRSTHGMAGGVWHGGV